MSSTPLRPNAEGGAVIFAGKYIRRLWKANNPHTSAQYTPMPISMPIHIRCSRYLFEGTTLFLSCTVSLLMVAVSVPVWRPSVGRAPRRNPRGPGHIKLRVLECPQARVDILPCALERGREHRRIARGLRCSIEAPLLMLHGTKDAIIPLRHGEVLFAAAHQPKTITGQRRHAVFRVSGRRPD